MKAGAGLPHSKGSGNSSGRLRADRPDLFSGLVPRRGRNLRKLIGDKEESRLWKEQLAVQRARRVVEKVNASEDAS